MPRAYDARGMWLAALVIAALSVSAPSSPECFGAASRDAAAPCSNPDLRQAVIPTPSEARTLPNSPCAPVSVRPPVCSFGAPSGPTVALVGDSHAGHWRGALDAVARAKGWRGLSITHSSCPLQKALRDLKEPRRTRCRAWKRDVFAWFARHPEVDTVFVAGLTGGSGVVPRAGMSRFDTSAQGYVDAWNALPVERIVVLRDTPKMRADTDTCVERAIKRRLDAGTACAVPRAEALDRDPAIAASARMPAKRVQTIDLTRFFCGPRACYPVIGGALVLRDNTHVTGAFSATLGPYLGRALDALSAAS